MLTKLEIPKVLPFVAPEECGDCRQWFDPSKITTFGLGAKRCPTCTEAFQNLNRAKREAELAADRVAHLEHVAALEETGECPDDGVVCIECCEHGDMENGVCGDCEGDFTDELAAAAYDRAKEARYE